jgi:DUF2950 family protein
MKTISISRTREREKSGMLRTLRLTAALAVAASVACATAWAQAPAAPAAAPGKSNRPQIEQRTFASADEASAALAEAMRTDDARKVFAVLGPGSGKLIYTGDKVADQRLRERFVAAWEKAHKFDGSNPARLTLLLGENDYPFPFPLVQEGSKWKFDAKAGAEEIVDRRVGRNELAAIQVCLAYVDAQREYALKDRDGDGLLNYAEKLVSSAGTHDGLYWPVKEGEPSSPFGPLMAQASGKGYGGPNDEAKAYHGYRYRILTAQGPDAPGGAYSYMAKGKMIGGFALIAWPARWGASGVMSFICNQDGVVYQKNLGRDSATVANGMTRYNPDTSWAKVEH